MTAARSVLDQPAPDWGSMPLAVQALHYAAALSEATYLGAVVGADLRAIEAAVRRHTPPAIAMRHDG